MSAHMSKTAALKAAQAACGRIHRRSRTDYVCFVPYYDQRPDGPSAELQADSYAKAAVMRARRVADIALALMGVTQAAGWWEVERAQFWFGETSAKGIVDRVLEELSADARNSGTKP